MQGCVRGTNCAFQGHRAVLTGLSLCRSTGLSCASIPGSRLPCTPTGTLWGCWGELETWRGKLQLSWWRTASVLPLSQKSRFVSVIWSVFSVHFLFLKERDPLTAQHLCHQWVFESPFWKLKFCYYFILFFWNLLDQWFCQYYGFSSQEWF